MNTVQEQEAHPRWDAFKRSFTESNYITDFWNWLMTLMSKAAELVLFGSVLYSGYQLLPNISHAPAQIDALVFVVQQGALDIGGMGLLKLAKRAGLPKESFPVRIGVTLVVLMILNVVLASVKQALPMIPPVAFLVVETLLLIARAVMAVLFGHAIHALREEYGDTTITVKEAIELQQQVHELVQGQAALRSDVHIAVQGVQASMRYEVQEMVQGVHTAVSREVQVLVQTVRADQDEQVHALVQSRVQGAVHEATQHLAQRLTVRVEEIHQQVQRAFAEQAGHPSSLTPALRLLDRPQQGQDQGHEECEQDGQEQGSVQSKVTLYISGQLEQGRKPTIAEIMDHCHCSKGTAIKYRKQVLEAADIDIA